MFIHFLCFHKLLKRSTFRKHKYIQTEDSHSQMKQTTNKFKRTGNKQGLNFSILLSSVQFNFQTNLFPYFLSPHQTEGKSENLEIHTLALDSITTESIYDKKSATKIWDKILV